MNMKLLLRLALLLSLGLSLSACFETIPKLQDLALPSLPTSPGLKERNASIARAWDQASLGCRAQHKPRGSFCEQLKTEGEYLSCAASGFTASAEKLRYPAQDQIWVWHNCVMTTASLLKDGIYLSKPELEKRMASCQARLDPEPEFQVRQSGWLAPLVNMVLSDDKEALRAVMPGDFAVNQPRLALVSCEARFAPPRDEAKPLSQQSPVAVPVSMPAVVTPVVIPPPPGVSSESGEAVKKPQARKAVPTKDVKTVGNKPADKQQRSTTPDGKPVPDMTVKACPIPGACGPTVPPDAIGR